MFKCFVICFEGGSVHFFNLSLSCTTGTGDKKFQFVLLNPFRFLSERNLLACQDKNMLPQEYNSKLFEILRICIFLKVKTSCGVRGAAPCFSVLKDSPMNYFWVES